MKRANRIFWGLVTMGGGALLILHMMGVGLPMDIVPAVGSFILLAVSVHSFAYRNFFGGFLPLAGIAYIWREPLGFPEMQLHLLLLAGLFLSIGLTIIFKPRQKHKDRAENWNHEHYKACHESGETFTGEFIRVESNFGDHARYIRSSNVKHVDIESNFSGVKVYFDQCQISPEGLVISIECNFSGVTLFVPRNWNVQSQCETFAGSVENGRFTGSYEEPLHHITLTGEVNFGSVKIIYI